MMASLTIRTRAMGPVKIRSDAKVKHSSLAVLAIVGYLMGEGCHSPFGVTGPTNTQLQQVWAPAFALLAAVIVAAVSKQATIEKFETNFDSWSKILWKLRNRY